MNEGAFKLSDPIIKYLPLLNAYNPYAIGKALYNALPAFLCGNANRKEDKIELCFNGKSICVDRSAAPGFVQKGAYLGACTQAVNESTNTSAASADKIQSTSTINAFPNPFTNHVTLSFKASQQGPANLSIYDMNGKLVTTLFNSVAEKEVLHTIDLSGSKMAAGVYICRLQTGTDASQQKIVLRK